MSYAGDISDAHTGIKKAVEASFVGASQGIFAMFYHLGVLESIPTKTTRR